MYLFLWAVIDGHVKLHLTSANVFDLPGCPSRLFLCRMFNTCAWNMSLLSTSIQFSLYMMLSFTLKCFIASFRRGDIGCLLAAINLCSLLFLWVSVLTQAIIPLSGMILPGFILLVTGVVISNILGLSCLGAWSKLAPDQCLAWSRWNFLSEKNIANSEVSANLLAVMFVGKSSWPNVSLLDFDEARSGCCDRELGLVVRLPGHNLISKPKHLRVSNQVASYRISFFFVMKLSRLQWLV